MEEFKDWIENIRTDAYRLSAYVDKDLVERLLYLCSIEKGSEDIKREVESLIDCFSHELYFSKKPLLEVPTRNEAYGEIVVGYVMQGDKTLWEFGLSLEELNQHMLITARSGAGKTTLIIQIIRQLISKHIPFIVIDYKRDYRHLVRNYPQLVVLSWRDLKINPLEPPPGVEFRDWKQQFLNIFGHVEAVWHGSTQYLLKAIDDACEEKKGYVTLEDVYNKIVESEEESRKMQEYASVVQTRLYGLLSKLGDTINNKRTLIDMERLLQLPVVLELDGLGRDEGTILTLWLFYWIYVYRRAKAMRGKLMHVLIIDEAKRVFTGSEQYSQTTAEYSGIPPADLICDEIRDFGEAIIASDQEPTKLSNSLKANTYTKITGCLGNGKDIDDIAEAMNLSDEEKEVIANLERGEWLVKLAGRYVKPFTIRSENFLLKKDVSDEELRQKMKPVLKGLYRKLENVENKEDALSEDAYKLLENVNRKPFNGVASRQRELQISAFKFEKAKEELISKGFVKQIDISISGRKPTSFLIPTEKALKFLEARKVDTSLWKHVGNIGFEHMLYQVLIRWEFEKLGYEARLEVKLSEGRRMDVLAVKDGRKIGVEVELNVNVNLKGKLNGIEGLNELYIVTSKEIFNEAKSELGVLPPHVKLYSIDKFLDMLRNLNVEKIRINPLKQNNSESISSWQNKSKSNFLSRKKGEMKTGQG